MRRDERKKSERFSSWNSSTVHVTAAQSSKRRIHQHKAAELVENFLAARWWRGGGGGWRDQKLSLQPSTEVQFNVLVSLWGLVWEVVQVRWQVQRSKKGKYCHLLSQKLNLFFAIFVAKRGV